MNSEKQQIEELFIKLCSQSIQLFPKSREKLSAPSEAGVYVIRKGNVVLHVGRTLRGKEGLYQRLNNHLRGSSSFVRKYLNGKGTVLRDGQHTYHYLVVRDSRLRALLEAYAVGMLCPQHIGLGK